MKLSKFPDASILGTASSIVREVLHSRLPASPAVILCSNISSNSPFEALSWLDDPTSIDGGKSPPASLPAAGSTADSTLHTGTRGPLRQDERDMGSVWRPTLDSGNGNISLLIAL